ncbi:MAG: M28 family peptidase [Planctomycetota bacterium]|nr:M28 family peptidase [Planctomycetota bacterium]MDA1112711.1 M28 family peptidase [Planctomycetota bacterium]
MILSTLLLLSAPVQEPVPSDIRVADIKTHIAFLASEELEGREAGKRGGHLAASYVENQFRRYGLKPITEDGSYRIPFKLGADTAYNVVGLLPGTDPNMQDVYFAIGGHHDHAGLGSKLSGAMGFPYEIHNGADDNASGTSGVLELAEYFTAHPLKHPILFMTFSGEERGLKGSEALVNSGVLPNDQIMAMINLDMIGRLDDDALFIGGLGTAEELHDILDPMFENSKLNLELDDRGEAPSDNTNFFHAGIPALFLFTNIHEDYHMPSDDADRINYEGEVKVLNMARDIVVLLDQQSSLTFVNLGGMGIPADFMSRMSDHYRRISARKELKGKLGLRVSVDEALGLVVNTVTGGSAAEAAGLEVGDQVTSIGGSETPDMNMLRRSLAAGLKGDEIEIHVTRGATKMVLTAVLK